MDGLDDDDEDDLEKDPELDDDLDDEDAELISMNKKKPK
jgi:hypothetical protein